MIDITKLRNTLEKIKLELARHAFISCYDKTHWLSDIKDIEQAINELERLQNKEEKKDKGVIMVGGKVNFEGKNYYYIGYERGYYNIGNKFLVIEIGVRYDKVEEIKTGWVK
jgi:hypothetical protein